VAYRFVTTCAQCAKEFGILWVMDSTQRGGPKTVAKITCPLCGKRFDLDAKDVLEIASQKRDASHGRRRADLNHQLRRLVRF
jgi:DNA-directed RNA polymerase subunit RPC12/RpoP